MLGILLSAVIAFSSTTFVGNAMAGIMLRLIQRMVRVTRRAGTFIDAAVSIGYATSHGSVEAALTEAAERIAEEIERRESEQEEKRLDEDASS